MIIIDAKKRVRYTPESERAEAKPTVYILRPMTSRETLELVEDASHANGTGKTVRVKAWRLVETCLVGWENVNDDAGQPLAFAPELVEHIPVEHAVEIVREINRMHLMEGEERSD